MNTLWKPCLVASLAMFLAACGREAADEAPEQAPPAVVSAAPDSGMMGGMGGMSGMQMGSEMMAHMGQMQGMHGDSLMQMMPMHRQMAETMMGQMEREMQGMNMGADPKWKALTDSIRSDMARMGQFSAAEMESFMADHHGRMIRMMEMHRTMMGTTEKPE